jgi:hypothetical protein
MPAKILLGELFGLELSAKANTIFWAAILGLGLFLVGVFFLKLTLAESLVGAIVCILLHYVSELVHQLGHAGAARRAGYPMRGVRFWGLLSTSVYPKDEPPLPGKIHIRRALGGPAVSLIFAMIWLLLVLIAVPVGGVGFWVAVFIFLDNLFVLTIGSLLPLPFTDGGTLVTWWGKP